MRHAHYDYAQGAIQNKKVWDNTSYYKIIPSNGHP